MSGPGKPSFLDPAEPLRNIRLRPAPGIIADDDEDFELYAKTVWARPCSEGWIGWHYKEHMTTQLQTIWLREMWEEVIDGG